MIRRAEQAAPDEVPQSLSGPSGDCVALADHRRQIRQYAPAAAPLPYATAATCPTCRSVVHAVYDWADPARPGGQIVLTWHCPACGPSSAVHHDTLWSQPESDFPGSASHTFGGWRVPPVLRRLPRTVQSLCPTCAAAVVGRYFVEDGAVWIEKICPAHGYVRDCVNSDALLYSKAAWWTFREHGGQQFPHKSNASQCPSDCGLCDHHLSSPCLAQIDLTNRCNMRCPICFANAGVTGYVSQPDYEQVVRQLQALRDLRPYPCTAIQFTGGEPTIHPDFLRIVATARDIGFSHIQIATNGIKMADADFARAAHEAGLHTLYMQFDGVGEEPHRHTRNYPGIWAKKLAAIENCRRLDLKICLVPTILKGINSDQVGEIFHFAAANTDVISGISYQPVSFSGRIDEQQRMAQRYTLGDLAHDLAEASGASALRDMYPLSIVVPLAEFLEALTGKPKIRPSAHPDCAFGTYFLISPEGKAYPFPQVINVEGMFTEMNLIAGRIKARGRVSWLDRIRIVRMFKRHFNPAAAPPGLTVKRFIRSLQGLVDKNLGRGEGEKQTYKTLLCAGMHFQDRFNFDAERARRCVIIYSTPAGMFPFCTYNCGPEYRTIVEQQHAAAHLTPPAHAAPAQSAAETS
ncbi:MAG: tetraether lipid synthase Tes [Phycisphaerae bacterium]